MSQMEREQHHPFCNFWHGPVSQCRQCPGLFSAYPLTAGETVSALIGKHFPEAQIVNGDPNYVPLEEKPE